MYLIVGEPNVTVLESFKSVCEQRNQAVLLLKELPQEFTWRFDGVDSFSEVVLRDLKVHADEIKGALVQNPLRITPAFKPEAEYACAETNAVLFAWFSSLACPVINRYPARYWFAPPLCLSLWEGLIRQSGLKTAPAILSNVESELEAFAAPAGGQVSFEPLCDSAAYRVSTKQAWTGLSKMAAICPVNLTRFFPVRYVACIVGNRVFWDLPITSSMADIQARLLQMSGAAELDFLQVYFAANGADLYVQRVEPFPKLEVFADETQRLIAEALVDRLDLGVRS